MFNSLRTFWIINKNGQSILLFRSTSLNQQICYSLRTFQPSSFFHIQNTKSKKESKRIISITESVVIVNGDTGFQLKCLNSCDTWHFAWHLAPKPTKADVPSLRSQHCWNQLFAKQSLDCWTATTFFSVLKPHHFDFPTTKKIGHISSFIYFISVEIHLQQSSSVFFSLVLLEIFRK